VDRGIQKQTRSLTILLSLALHIVGLMLLLMAQEMFKDDEATQTQQQAQQDAQRLINQILAQSRTPHAKVQFRDAPEPRASQASQATTATQMAPTAAPTAIANAAPTYKVPAAELAQTPVPPAPALPERQTSITEPIPMVADADNKNQAIPYRRLLQNRSEQQDRQTTRTSEQGSSRQSAHSIHASSADGRPSGHGTSKISLADLTQGFLQSAQNERGAMPKKDSVGQDLALSRYYARIWSALRQSFNIEQELLQLRNSTTTDTLLILTIDKGGAVLQVSLQHPQKTPELRVIEESLRHAALNAGLLPPPPKVLLGTSDRVSLRLPLRVDAKSGNHSYQLSCN